MEPLLYNEVEGLDAQHRQEKAVNQGIKEVLVESTD